MKKYLFIYKSELMSNLQYVLNVIFSFIGVLIYVFIFFMLWKYIYSDPNEVINGYTMEQMVWYIIIAEILIIAPAGGLLCNKISKDVRSGSIAYQINKPYSYISYILSSHLGATTLKLLVFLVLGLILGFIFLGGFPELNLIKMFLILITMLLSIVITILLISFIGLFSFIIEDSNPFYWLYSKAIMIFGVFFPIEFFPAVIKPILFYSPIYAIAYGPSKLFVEFSWSSCFSVIGAQIIYVIIAYVMCDLVYRKGVKNLNVNGG